MNCPNKTLVEVQIVDLSISNKFLKNLTDLTRAEEKIRLNVEVFLTLFGSNSPLKIEILNFLKDIHICVVEHLLIT